MRIKVVFGCAKVADFRGITANIVHKKLGKTAHWFLIFTTGDFP